MTQESAETNLVRRRRLRWPDRSIRERNARGQVSITAGTEVVRHIVADHQFPFGVEASGLAVPVDQGNNPDRL